MARIETARQIGAAVRSARTQQGLTQQQLADAAGVSRGLINRLEKGAAAALYPEKLLAVLDALGLSLSIDSKTPGASGADSSEGAFGANVPEGAPDPSAIASARATDVVANASGIGTITGARPSDVIASVSGIVSQLTKNAGTGIAIREAKPLSIAKIAEQITSSLANEHLYETSPLFAPRTPRTPRGEGGEDE